MAVGLFTDPVFYNIGNGSFLHCFFSTIAYRQAKGFYHWQLVYAFQNEDEQDYQLMKRYLPMLFPHLELDLSDFGIENDKK